MKEKRTKQLKKTNDVKKDTRYHRNTQVSFVPDFDLMSKKYFVFKTQ